MTRQVVRGLVALVLVAAVLDSAGRGQPGSTPDRIYYRDKKDSPAAAPKAVEGELKAAAAGYQIVANGKVVAVVSPADIVRVVPGDVPGLDRKDVLAQVALEEKRDWEKARVGYVEIQKKTAGAPEKARRLIDFKVATMAAKAADDGPEEGSQPKAEEATKLLEAYLGANKSGWEVWPAAQACARLQVSMTVKTKDGEKETERRMFEEAGRTWGKVARNPEVPADLRQEAAVEEVDCAVRAHQWTDVARLAEEAKKTAAPGPGKDRLAIYELAAKGGAGGNPLAETAAIEAEIGKTKDPAVRAAGYGTLGELYLAADKPREAMWNFLWVEVVYNQDRDEVIKALVRLADVFRLQGDEARATAYREKVRRYRGAL